MTDTKPQALIGLDRIIHEPGRLMLLCMLYAVDRADFLYLKRETGLTRGNLSAHMNKLESAGYVVVEKVFEDKIPRTIYQLTAQGRKAFDSYKDLILKTLASLTNPLPVQ
ncbi:MAG: transcriptional regulator [Acidobacteriota bacterium]|nr:transcriptional regulator [Acidobacteriota bacterium]